MRQPTDAEARAKHFLENEMPNFVATRRVVDILVRAFAAATDKGRAEGYRAGLQKAQEFYEEYMLDRARQLVSAELDRPEGEEVRRAKRP